MKCNVTVIYSYFLQSDWADCSLCLNVLMFLCNRLQETARYHRQIVLLLKITNGTLTTFITGLLFKCQQLYSFHGHLFSQLKRTLWTLQHHDIFQWPIVIWSHDTMSHQSGKSILCDHNKTKKLSSKKIVFSFSFNCLWGGWYITIKYMLKHSKKSCSCSLVVHTTYGISF